MSFNDIPHSITLEVQEVARPKVYFGYVAPASSRPEDQLEIVVGCEDSPDRCLIENIEFAEHLGGHNYVMSLTGSVFAETGTFHYQSIIMKGRTCKDIKTLYEKYPENRQTIGTIVVVGEEEEEICTVEYTGGFIIDTLGGLDVPCNIVIRRCNTDFIVEITVPNGMGIQSGSVSFSIDEEIFVQYDTGNIETADQPGDIYLNLIPPPENFFAEKSALLVAGFIPGLSCVLYLEEIMDETLMEYKEIDPKNIQTQPLSDYFDTHKHTNARDIVTIPWSILSIGKSGIHSVRIYCPRLEFHELGTHNIIFRLDFRIQNTRVRYDIGLPIEIGKQKKEI
jgi:hypothetical protein